MVGCCGMTQVQVRMPEELVKELDKWVSEGAFKSRSDAIKTIIRWYEDRDRSIDRSSEQLDTTSEERLS